MNAKAFQNFVQTQYQTLLWSSLQKDAARKNPQIPASTIYQAMVAAPVMGARSILELDQKGRFQTLKQLVGSKRVMVASDSTLLRTLSAWDLRPTRMANYATHIRMRQKGLSKQRMPSGRKVQLAIVDGTHVGGHWMSVLGFAGRIYQAVDLEEYAGRGHELAASRALLMRAGEYLGPGFATHVLYDGLMAVRKDFAFVREILKSHLLVKTQEESLELIESSRQVWSQSTESDLKRWGVEIERGVDSTRAISYVVYAQGGMNWKGLEFPLKLAWVREKHLKGKYKGETLDFWVMTTDESLHALDMREIAHARWAIETGFKELNERLGSKRAYLKNAHAKQAVMLMGFQGMALAAAFRLFLETSDAWCRWTVRKTKRLVGWVIEFGIPGEAATGLSPP